MSKIIAITGGTGMIGKHLAVLLKQQGYSVRIITRQKLQDDDDYEYFLWNPEAGELDEKALADTTAIVHLAGAGIADKKWTRERKKAILDSRVDTVRLLLSGLKAQNHSPESFISASGIGYYGYDTGSILVKETSRFGDDFVATVVKKWEAAADEFESLGVRVVKLRTGLVLSKQGGAMARLVPPVRMGIGSPLGRGDQYMSWIHIRDLIQVFLHAIENDQVKGAYNVVSPNPVTNKVFMKTLAGTLKRPFFLPPVPAFALKLLLGEMASLVIGGNNVSSQRLLDTGFHFEFGELQAALTDLLTSK